MMTRAEINRRYFENMTPEMREKYLARRRGWFKTRPNKKAKVREYNLLSKYGLTTEDFDTMLAEQGGVCKICKKVPKILHVDHDHATNKVRGILCQKCNILLGHADDDPKILMSAIDYLQKSGN